MRVLLLLIFTCTSFISKSNSLVITYIYQTESSKITIAIPHKIANWKIKAAQKLFQKKEKPKLTAITLAILLGPFGVHRLYLGTSPHVPIAYTLTLGGGVGILPLTDIIAIIISKDLEKYRNNNKVVMWVR